MSYTLYARTLAGSRYKYKWPGMLAFAVLWLILPGSVLSSEFRSFRPILTPAVISGGHGMAAKAAVVKPVSRNLAGKAMSKIIAAWNGNNINSVLSDNFFDKSLLSNAMDSKVPRDARLEVLSIQEVQTLNQQVLNSPNGRIMVSRVSITARTQLTFNDPANGYQRREGMNEYIMRIKQRIR